MKKGLTKKESLKKELTHKGLTELVFILDKSGSMGGLERDTIGGFNAMLEKQKAAVGECRITTVLFDNDYELLHDRFDIRSVSPLTDRDYEVRGTTSLLDAIGLTIDKIDNVQRKSNVEYRAKKVLFVIITDGEENSSTKYTAKKVKDQIELQKAKNGWEFIFLGANIDAVETAARIGITRNRAQNYHADGVGSKVIYDEIAQATVEFRENEKIPEDWNNVIEADYQRRRES
jgi:uncharacterized protein YegL